MENERKGQLARVLGMPAELTDNIESDKKKPIKKKKEDEYIRQIVWLKPYGRAGRLEMEISVNRSSVSLGDELAGLLGGAGARVQFGVAQYQGRAVILIRKAESGYGYIIYHKRGYSKAGSPKLISLFREAGLPHGRYMVRKIKDKDNFVATPLIEEHQKNEG